jgi:hypothetical protein
MAYQALERPIDVPPQDIEPFERKGFTVVEWGGTEVAVGGDFTAK